MMERAIENLLETRQIITKEMADIDIRLDDAWGLKIEYECNEQTDAKPYDDILDRCRTLQEQYNTLEDRLQDIDNLILKIKDYMNF